MKYLKNENGSAIFYLLWIMTTIVIISVIVLNIARVYVVKQQAATGAQLGAIAATNEILATTKAAIQEYDTEMARIIAERNAELEEGEEPEVYDPLWDSIWERTNQLTAPGNSRQMAYIQALNGILPSMLNDCSADDAPCLKEILYTKVFIDPAFRNQTYDVVKRIVIENGGNEERLEIKISKDKYRVEIKTDATYESITDGSLLTSFSKDIKQQGYGLPLLYLKYVFN
ncbi:hypothetical protein [Solibacillus sp. CAU 1738]|uniref:hypothetical protein n=1 Tax=Solibacillus sp. CAU 1738 TaxID=3140363 RepID=UPI00325FF093